MPNFNPSVNDDSTITAVVAQPASPFGDAHLLTLALPAGQASGVMSGRYFLARCGAHTELERAEQWHLYFRRPLFIASHGYANSDGQTEHELWEVILPISHDPGIRWLAEQTSGAPVNLLGPLGQGFRLLPLARNLLLATDSAHLPLLLGLIDPLLNRGGRVTLLLRTTTPPPDELRTRLPIPVELRLAPNDEEWQRHLAETLRWADQVCAALPNPDYPLLAAAIRQLRFRLENGFAQVLVQADLVCGVGACLACIVPLPDGSFTRACIHGPVFDLAQIVGR